MLRNCCSGRGFWLLLSVLAFAGVVFVISRNYKPEIYPFSFNELYSRFRANSSKGFHPKFNNYKNAVLHRRHHYQQAHILSRKKNISANKNQVTAIPHHPTKQLAFETKPTKPVSDRMPNQYRYNYNESKNKHRSHAKKNNKPIVTNASHHHIKNYQHHFNPTAQQGRGSRVQSCKSAFPDVAKESPLLQPGGAYKPRKKPRQKVAIIIPFKNRNFQLRMLLHHLHPILQKQNLEYKIFVINQAGHNAFNKGKLLNAGFKEVYKHDNSYQCFIFHDVNLLPEDSRCFYTCSDGPRHIATAISKHYYRYRRTRSMEGVTAFSRRQFLDVNGWSNRLGRWKDEDMTRRIRRKHLKLWRTSTAICRFTSLPQPPKRERDPYYRHSHHSIMSRDGLNSLKYKHIASQAYVTYTNITVEFI